MSAIILPPSKWRKGHGVTINGDLHTLIEKPKKAIDGSWIVFMTNAEGKVVKEYIREEQVEGLKS